MPINELFSQYKHDKCKGCKNNCKEVNVCNITIHEDNNTREARCDYYEEKR
jgi:hypothetical protein